MTNEAENLVAQDHEKRLTKLELVVDNIHMSLFHEIKESMKQMNKRLDDITKEISDLRKELNDLRKEGSSNFRYTISIILILMPVVLKILHVL